MKRVGQGKSKKNSGCFLKKREKFAINNLKDLERFAETKGRTMGYFDFEMADNDQNMN